MTMTAQRYGRSARLDCLHFRSRTSSSKDVERANALARGGLSSCSTTISGSASTADEQCSWTSSSASAESEANLLNKELSGFTKKTPKNLPPKLLQVSHMWRSIPVAVCWCQCSSFGLLVSVLFAHFSLLDGSTIRLPTWLLCQACIDIK